MHTADFPHLHQYIGQTLITTDGTTLLGADDKAGVAILMELAQHLTVHSEVQHGDICLAFTTDEEIGRGTDGFDVAAFGAKYAYTIDGGAIGELEYENFNAAMATLHMKGCNMHPGEAGKTFKNALILLDEFNRLLPADQRPETTSGYEGFFLLSQVNGTTDAAKAKYLIRDHSWELFQAKKEFLHQIVAKLNQQYGNDTFRLHIDDQYYNMRSKIEEQPIVVEKALEALRNAGVPAVVKPIRGGTDGARLTYMGLPCPNLFTGGHNFHSIYEYIPLQSMHKALEVVLCIVESYNE
jgi:tripeptide aminopeptidase